VRGSSPGGKQSTESSLWKYSPRDGEVIIDFAYDLPKSWWTFVSILVISFEAEFTVKIGLCAIAEAGDNSIVKTKIIKAIQFSSRCSSVYKIVRLHHLFIK
jgi:hypothetical protein